MRRLLSLLLLLGCSRAPASPTQPEQLTLAGLRCLSQYQGGARPGDDVPLLLVLHPMGGTLEGALELVQGLRRPVRVVAPCGRESGGVCDWYDLRDTEGPWRSARTVLAVAAQVPHVGKPLVMGFSQGAVVAFAVAQRYPTELAAAFPVAGTLPPGGASVAGPFPPVHAFLGAQDPVFPLKAVQESVASLKAQGFEADLQVFPGLEHEVNGAEVAALHAAIERALR